LQDFYAIYIYYGKHTLTNNSGRDCKKAKKRDYQQYRPEYGGGNLGPSVLTELRRSEGL